VYSLATVRTMSDSLTGTTKLSLLRPDEPSAVEVVNAEGGSHIVLVCDHASNRVPTRLGTLGLDTARLADHIGWDPGAADVARRLSDSLDAPLILSGYSRLVIDCNRPLRSAESIPEQSAGVMVPGNRALSATDREIRVKELFSRTTTRSIGYSIRALEGPSCCSVSTPSHRC